MVQCLLHRVRVLVDCYSVGAGEGLDVTRFPIPTPMMMLGGLGSWAGLGRVGVGGLRNKAIASIGRILFRLFSGFGSYFERAARKVSIANCTFVIIFDS